MHRTLLRLLPASLLAAAALAAGAPAAGAACTGADLTYSAANAAAMADAVSCLVNAERTARGLPALTRDARLDSAAYDHSADMAQNNYFDHDSLDGTTFSERITAAGYTWNSAGENIAAGQRTPRSVMTAWMASTGHCQNILRDSFADIGVGLYSGGSYGLYWTQDFGRQSGSSASSNAADGCPFKSLVSETSGETGGGTSDTSASCSTAASAGKVKLTSLRRIKGSKLRIAGRLTAAGCCPKVRLTVKRGGRTVKSTKTICKTKFVVKLRLPGRRGNVRVRARVALSGATAARTLKL